MLVKRDSNNDRQKSPVKRFLSILGLFMFGLYLVLGLVIIFWDQIPLALNKTYRVLFGLLLIIYSFIRFVRLWKNQQLDRKRS